jgi:hypothetical protein
VAAAAHELIGDESNQRSTWLIQLELVVVLCMWKRGRLASQALIVVP